MINNSHSNRIIIAQTYVKISKRGGDRTSFSGRAEMISVARAVLEIPARAGSTAEKFHVLSGFSNEAVVDAFGHIDSSAVRINERLQYETGYSSYSHGVDGHSIADSEGLTNHNANGSL